MKIEKVGVVGCGQMGSGIAQVCAQSGYSVVVSENTRELLQKGFAAIEASLNKSVNKAKITRQEKDNALARISGTTDIVEFRGCDLVIEAVAEDIDLKKRVFSGLDNICGPETLLATNTSSLSVGEIATATSRRDKVIGIHFFNPVPELNLLEIVKANATSDATIALSVEFAKSLGKTPVIVQDSPGFIVNRLMVPQILNAIRLVESGIATIEDIDTAVTLGLKHPMGPLALADLVGLDTLLNIASIIYGKSGDTQYAPPETLKKLVASGYLGRKTRRGFYEYLG